LKRISLSKIKVGLVWAAKATNEHERSCPPNNFLPLFEFDQIQIYGRQKGSDARQADDFADHLV
jgi:hypothetical protein